MRSIHILHHSISPFVGQYPEGDPLHYNTGIPMLFGRAILEHYPTIEVEVWRPECTLRQGEYQWRDEDDILHRVFRSTRVRINVEYSSALIRALRSIGSGSDVVIWFHGIYNLQAYMAASRLPAVPVIAQSHGGYPGRALFQISHHPWKRFYYLLFDPVERGTLPRFPHFFAISSQEQQYLEKFTGIPRNRVSFSPTGMSFERFSPGDKAESRICCGIPAEQRVILYVGRLIHEKGLEYLIEAFKTVQSEIGGAHLYLIGDGPLRPTLQAQVSRDRMEAQVDFVGYVHSHLLPDWYRAADVVVMPSFYEWFGKVAAEAMACGTPVVTTQTGGTIDIVREFECGILVPPRDTEGLASAIQKVLSGMYEARPNIERGRSMFDWNAKLRHAFAIFAQQRDSGEISQGMTNDP